jgi:hypothetical protein
MTTDNVCVYLENRLIQTSQTGGQGYSDTSPFSSLAVPLDILGSLKLLFSCMGVQYGLFCLKRNIPIKIASCSNMKLFGQTLCTVVNFRRGRVDMQYTAA